jgi:hypothetical protein
MKAGVSYLKAANAQKGAKFDAKISTMGKARAASTDSRCG